MPCRRMSAAETVKPFSFFSPRAHCRATNPTICRQRLIGRTRIACSTPICLIESTSSRIEAAAKSLRGCVGSGLMRSSRTDCTGTATALPTARTDGVAADSPGAAWGIGAGLPATARSVAASPSCNAETHSCWSQDWNVSRWVSAGVAWISSPRSLRLAFQASVWLTTKR